MQPNELTQAIIGAAIEVHRWLGPGLLESVYEEALCHELDLRGIPFRRQLRVSIGYKDVRLASELRLDLLVEEQVIVDLKAKEALSPLDKPQLLTYLRLCNLRVGLIINFHVLTLKEGVFRVVNRLMETGDSPTDRPDLQAPDIRL